MGSLESKVLMNRINAVMKGAPESSLTVFLVFGQTKLAMCELERGPLSKLCLDLELANSQNCEQQVCTLYYSASW